MGEKSSINLSAPKWVVIQLLEQCNLRCKMCYEWGQEGTYHHKENLSQLDPKVVKRLILDLKDQKPYFGLFGGEPLMYPHIEEVLQLIRDYDCKVDIPTNGTLLEQRAEMLIKTKPTRLWISLDGPEEINDTQRGKGVYEKVTKGIHKLHELREIAQSEYPKIGVTFIVTPTNYQYIEEFFLHSINLNEIDHLSIEFQLFATEEKYQCYKEVMATEFDVTETPCGKGITWDINDFKQIDVPSVVAQITKVKEECEARGIYFIAYPKTITVENLTHFYNGQWDQMKDKRKHCAFPWSYAEVNARGNVTTCHTFYDLTHGNVNEQSILDIWRGESVNRFRKYIKKSLLPICTACSRYYSDPTKK